jgi:hypothetical protein
VLVGEGNSVVGWPAGHREARLLGPLGTPLFHPALLLSAHRQHGGEASRGLRKSTGTALGKAADRGRKADLAHPGLALPLATCVTMSSARCLIEFSLLTHKGRNGTE